MNTAVEWLMEELQKHGSGAVRTFGDLFEQAKEMEKQQIVKAYNESFVLRDKPYATAEKYYNETFKQEQ
jgi:hypothetical protein